MDDMNYIHYVRENQKNYVLKIKIENHNHVTITTHEEFARLPYLEVIL